MCFKRSSDCEWHWEEFAWDEQEQGWTGGYVTVVRKRMMDMLMRIWFIVFPNCVDRLLLREPRRGRFCSVNSVCEVL